MFPVNKNVVYKNNTIQQCVGKMRTTYGLDILVNYINSKGKLPNVKYLAIKPIYDKHTWNWSKKHHYIDFIRYIPLKYIKMMQRKELVLIFDNAQEAFDPINEILFWETIRHNIKRYRIDPDYFWYLSSNVNDRRYSPGFRVYSEHFWSYGIAVDDVDKAFEETVNNTIKTFDKERALFSSLNGQDKIHRHWWHYKLFKSKLDQYAMISNPRVNFTAQRQLVELGESDFHTKRWAATTPRTVDRDPDPSKNHGWVNNQQYLKKDYAILDASAFHIALETYIEPGYNNKLLSEKTWKPYARFIPTIVLSINDTSKHLSQLGYDTLYSVFGLEETWDKHEIERRYTEALNAVDITCKKLNAMTNTQIIDWKFKKEKVLKQNYTILQSNNINCKWRDEFIENMETVYENT